MNEDNKDIEVWKQRNEILHKKVERLTEELRAEHKLRQEAEGETNIVKAIGINSPEMKQAIIQIKELENRLAEVLTIDGDHQKLNGKMQMKITELEQENLELYADNKKISRQVEDQLNRARKAGL
tara:strand:+ start:361 stop:735 length:375 start_codon:yes stop_codon:yes gene_type:complete